MKYYLIVGEASGDLHASNLMKALQKEDAAANFRFWGGDLMAAVGGQLMKHYRALAFMGLVEVLKNVRTISENLRACKADIQSFQPDVLILVDYSGFNLRMAKWAKQHQHKVFYYIAPQVWASRPKRALTIKENVDQLFAILPFEQAFYQEYGMTINYVGHPLLDVLDNYPYDTSFLEKHQISRPIIALLPGSRKQEIRRILKVLLPMVEKFPDYQFVIAAAPAIPIAMYTDTLKAAGIQPTSVKIIQDATYDLLKNATAAIVTSGTATLEAALLGVPQVVVYKGSWLTYQVVKRVIQVPYISLVNLIADQALVQELLQDDLTSPNLERALNRILTIEKAKELKEGYVGITEALGKAGASERAAKLMVDYLST